MDNISSVALSWTFVFIVFLSAFSSCERSQEVTFLGESFVKSDLKDSGHFAWLSLEFYTHLPQGLLLLATGSKGSVIVQLKEGRVEVRFTTAGSPAAVVSSSSKVDDSRWHSVALNTSGRAVSLTLDGYKQNEIPLPDVFSTDTSVYLGDKGDLGDDITGRSKSFRGCMRNVYYNSQNVLDHARDSQNAPDVIWQCDEEIRTRSSLLINFNHPTSFVAFPHFRTDSDRQGSISLELKTRSQDGFVLFSSGIGSFSQHFISLQLISGKPNLLINLGGATVNIASGSAVNDGKWHHIKLLVTHAFAQLEIDTFRNVTNFLAHTVKDVNIGGHLFIGGLGPKARQHATSFGLISDAFNGAVLGCVRSMSMNSHSLGFGHIQISRQVDVGCSWQFPCADDPCVANATCVEFGGEDYSCDCDEYICDKKNIEPDHRVQNLQELLSTGKLEVKERGMALLSLEIIRINKDILRSSIREESISFFIKEPPSEGFLEIRRKPNQTRFTLKDLNDNAVYYRHLGGKVKYDSITLELSYVLVSKDPGAELDHFNFVVPVTIIGNPKLEITLRNGPILNITSGSSFRLTPSILNVKSSVTDASVLRFSIAFLRQTLSSFVSSEEPKVPITSFTFKDIQEGKIWFKHKGDNMVYTKVNVTDGVSVSSAVDLRFKVEDLQLSLQNITGLLLNYGSRGFITSANLSVTTNVPFEELEVKYAITQPPRQGVIQRMEYSLSQWVNTTSFSQRHIDTSRLRYLHLPGRDINMHDSFTFEVLAKSKKIQPQVFTISFKTVTLTIEQNNNLILNQVSFGKLTNSTLLVVSESDDFDSRDMHYILLRPPQLGTLHLVTQNIIDPMNLDNFPSLQVDNTFTQQDVNNGYVYYKLAQPASERKSDFADLHASFFGFTVMIRAMLEYSPDKPAIKFVNNILRDVPEGGSAVIQKQDLSLEMDELKNFKFWIVKSPSHGSINIKDLKSSSVAHHNITAFTMKDIYEGKLIYTHDDSENSIDSFHFIAYPLTKDSEESTADEFPGKFLIRMTMKNDNSPVRSVNKVFQISINQVKQLTIEDLAFTDPDIDFDDSQLTFQFQPSPSGEIIRLTTDEVVYNFTQKDLKQGKLRFKHKKDSNLQIPLSVSDGKFFTTGFFVVQASASFIRVVNNTGVEVKQAHHVLITSFNLSVETNLNWIPEAILFQVMEAPKFGEIHVNRRNTMEFTYQDLLNETVHYYHGGGSGSEDKVTFLIRLESSQTRIQFVIRISADGITDPPEIVHNQILRVTALQSETISSKHLNAAHKLYPPHEVEFIVTQLPLFGHLVIKGQPINMGNVPEFTQQDIADGQVVYSSDSSEATSDRFVFDVGTEFQSLRQLDFLIEIVPQTLQMNQVNATVKEGGSLVIGTNLLQFKPPLAANSKATLSVYQYPVHGKILLRGSQKEDQVSIFTYEDVSRNRVRYVHDNSESLSDELSIRVEGQEGKLPARMVVVQLEVIPIDDQPPIVVTNTGLDLWTGSLQLLTNKELMASDPDTISDQIEFRISNPSNGHLAFLNNTFKQIVRFSQRDLDSGNIVFVHKGNEIGTFTFHVTDGINSGHPKVFRVRARPVELTVAVNLTLKAFPGFIQPITNSSILVRTSSSNFTHPILFSLLDSSPRKGKLVTKINQKFVEVTSFTQSDINEGKLFYKHTAESRNWLETDAVFFEITTVYAQPIVNKSLKIEISFSNINEDNYQELLHIKPLHIKEGGKVTINGDYFNSSAFVAKIRSFRSSVEVEFSFTTLPSHGYLWFDGRAAKINEVFMQENLNQGLLSYKHDNTETYRDKLSFAVKILVPRSPGEHVSSSAQVFNMDIFMEPVNDAGFEMITRYPRVTVKQGSEVVILPQNLTTIDLDTGPEGIEYIIVTQPSNGHLVKLPDSKSRISQFTQKDINDNKIVFKHDGTRKSRDSLYLKFWDGLLNPQFSNVDIFVDLLNINVDKDSHVPLVQGNKTVTLSNKHLKITTNGDYNALAYRIKQLPIFGKILKQNAQVIEFSQADLDRGLIYYIQNSDSPGDDYFTCTLRLKNIDCTHDEIGFDITMKPLIKQSPLVTSSGSQVAITRSSLDASDLAHLTNDNPHFDIATPPVHGKVMRRHRQRRDANLESHFQPVSKFSFEDILYTKIYYVANEKSVHNGTDSFIYKLSAKGVPSANGEFIIHLNPPTTLAPVERDTAKTDAADQNFDKSKAEGEGSNASTDSVVQVGPNIQDDNGDVVIIATVLSLILLICLLVLLVVLFLRWRRRNRPTLVHETKAAKPRPYISGPLQLEQPHVHIEHHDRELASPASRESMALMGGSHDSESEYINTFHAEPADNECALQQLSLRTSSGTPSTQGKADGTYSTPGGKTSSGQDSHSSDQLSEDLDRPSTRASGRESIASTDLMDWSLMEPDLLQHCRTTTPVLRNNQYWL